MGSTIIYSNTYLLNINNIVLDCYLLYLLKCSAREILKMLRFCFLQKFEVTIFIFLKPVTHRVSTGFLNNVSQFCFAEQVEDTDVAHGNRK